MFLDKAEIDRDVAELRDIAMWMGKHGYQGYSGFLNNIALSIENITNRVERSIELLATGGPLMWWNAVRARNILKGADDPGAGDD